jgi:hypothetical protein
MEYLASAGAAAILFAAVMPAGEGVSLTRALTEP